MTWLWQTVSVVVITQTLLGSAVVHADDDDIIDYRVHIMKTLDEQAAAVGMIIEQKAPPNNLNTHMRILAATSATALKAFEPKVAGGSAKPAVWTNWMDFSKRMNDLSMNLASLGKDIDGKNIATAAPRIQAAFSACKGCHDVYSKPLEK